MTKAKDQPTRADLERESVALEQEARIDPDRAPELNVRIREIRALLDGALPGDPDQVAADPVTWTDVTKFVRDAKGTRTGEVA